MNELQHHQLTILIEEATSRPRNSDGAWHVKLTEFVRELGYDVSGYEQALMIAKSLLGDKLCQQ